MPKFSFAGGQAVGDVAQARDRAQLTKQHRHQLAPAGEAFGVAFGIMLANGGIEVGAGDQLQDLGENAAYYGQGCVLLLTVKF
jgi:hypothetical protein